MDFNVHVRTYNIRSIHVVRPPRPPREPGMERNGTERNGTGKERNGTVYPYNIRFLPVLLKTGTRATAVLRNGNGKFFVTPTVHVHVFK